MHILSKEFTSKFDSLLSEIHQDSDNLKISGAEAMLNSDFSEVTEIQKKCLKLQELESNLKEVLNQFKLEYEHPKLTTNIRKRQLNPPSQTTPFTLKAEFFR
ncbi:MAG: hypothetical protein RQ875_14570 [Vicingaceae bacterium]|nr:hypothetical protein [Vicingaceae bacterium]